MFSLYFYKVDEQGSLRETFLLAVAEYIGERRIVSVGLSRLCQAFHLDNVDLIKISKETSEAIRGQNYKPDTFSIAGTFNVHIKNIGIQIENLKEDSNYKIDEIKHLKEDISKMEKNIKQLNDKIKELDEHNSELKHKYDSNAKVNGVWFDSQPLLAVPDKAEKSVSVSPATEQWLEKPEKMFRTKRLPPVNNEVTTDKGRSTPYRGNICYQHLLQQEDFQEGYVSDPLYILPDSTINYKRATFKKNRSKGRFPPRKLSLDMTAMQLSPTNTTKYDLNSMITSRYPSPRDGYSSAFKLNRTGQVKGFKPKMLHPTKTDAPRKVAH